MTENLARFIQRAAFFSALLLILPLAAACQQTAQPKSVNQSKSNAQASLPANTRGAIWKEIPDKIDPSAKYLFYMHGIIVENEGIRPTSPRFGVYEYEQILETLAGKGFIVISEARPKGTIVTKYAAKVVSQINKLLKAGVAPQHITIVGASRGGGIAIAVSSQLRNRDVNFVIMAACGDFDIYKTFRTDLWGNVLSIYDHKDTVTSCQPFFDKSKTGLNRHREIVTKLGVGHGLLYRPLKEWVDPVIEWANQS
ncbi:MAG TPA: alpha/beta hydrolase [Pyrinomonadaceae bacterium]|nr:alpha/beta hydrolase [Pyrinomonadaceae bacterium]